MSDISFESEDTSFEAFMNNLPSLPTEVTGVDRAETDTLIAELARNYPLDSIDALRFELTKDPDENQPSRRQQPAPLKALISDYVAHRQLEHDLKDRLSDAATDQQLQPVKESEPGHSSLLPHSLLKQISALKGSLETQGKIQQAMATLTNVNASEAEQQTAAESLLAIIQTRHDLILKRQDRQNLQAALRAELTGFGPLEALMADDSVSEIMVNDPKSVFITKRNQLQRSNIVFEDNDHVTRIATQLLRLAGVDADEHHLVGSARLLGQWALQVVKPPAATWTSITISKYSKWLWTVEDLIRFGTMTAEIAEFLRACVIARMNILISGTRGASCTTFLNVLSGFIPNSERVVSIEYDRELQLRQEHVVSLAVAHSGQYGNHEANFGYLLAGALNMRADRLIFGALTDGDILKALKAILSGYDGTILIIGGHNGLDSLHNLEILCQLANFNLPVHIIREIIASSIDIVISINRFRDGSRKITQILEVNGMKEEDIAASTIFEFEQTGIEAGRIIGRLRPTGKIPEHSLESIEACGIHLPRALFGAGILYDL